ncbi:MAG: hypothetical protein LC803_08925 [Acidobacteria bacterium]|nr:hypothetical protein [Acidobacteriota bacterium]
MPRKSRRPEIIESIRAYLPSAEKRLESITDERLMDVAGCGRATFYKYVSEGSEIELEINASRERQKKYVKSVERGDITGGDDIAMRKRLGQAEEGNRNLLAFIARMTDNLRNYGVPSDVIQSAQQEAMTHPDRSYSHAGKGRRRH